MTHRTTTFPPAAVEALRRTVAGQIVYPTDPSYSTFVPSARADQVLPAVVVVPDTEEAVRAAVDVARAHGLTVTSDLGPAVPGASMLVLTHLLDDLAIDPDARTATLGPGVTWARLTDSLDGTGLDLAPAGAPGSAVVDAVSADLAPVLWARVVRRDGFVHVVADLAPPVDDPGPWVVTAVAVPLTRSTTQPIHPQHTHENTQPEEIPS